MTFTVTYRGADGALREGRVEAANRTECFAQMKAQGIAPKSVKEEAVVSRRGRRDERGKNGRVERAEHVEGKGRVVAYVLSVALVALIAGGAWWWLGRGAAQPPQTEKPAKPKAERPQTPQKAGITNVPAQQLREAKPAQPAEAAKPEAPKRETWMGREIVSKKVVTNGTDLIITRVDVDGKVHKEYTSIHRRLFSNPVDITLSILLTTPEGALTPPLPPLGPRAGDAFIEALKRPIDIPEDATPEERRTVELVLAAREEMLEELGNGRTVNDVIEEHCTFADENNRLRAEAMVQYKRLAAEGDGAMAEEFRAKANEMLAQKGAKPLKSLAEIRRERVSRREERT